MSNTNSRKRPISNERPADTKRAALERTREYGDDEDDLSEFLDTHENMEGDTNQEEGSNINAIIEQDGDIESRLKNFFSKKLEEIRDGVSQTVAEYAKDCEGLKSSNAKIDQRVQRDAALLRSAMVNVHNVPKSVGSNLAEVETYLLAIINNNILVEPNEKLSPIDIGDIHWKMPGWIIMEFVHRKKCKTFWKNIGKFKSYTDHCKEKGDEFVSFSKVLEPEKEDERSWLLNFRKSFCSKHGKLISNFPIEITMGQPYIKIKNQNFTVYTLPGVLMKGLKDLKDRSIERFEPRPLRDVVPQNDRGAGAGRRIRGVRGGRSDRGGRGGRGAGRGRNNNRGSFSTPTRGGGSQRGHQNKGLPRGGNSASKSSTQNQVTSSQGPGNKNTPQGSANKNTPQQGSANRNVTPGSGANTSRGSINKNMSQGSVNKRNDSMGYQSPLALPPRNKDQQGQLNTTPRDQASWD